MAMQPIDDDARLRKNDSHSRFIPISSLSGGEEGRERESPALLPHVIGMKLQGRIAVRKKPRSSSQKKKNSLDLGNSVLFLIFSAFRVNFNLPSSRTTS